jgi:hypothetical protein
MTPSSEWLFVAIALAVFWKVAQHFAPSDYPARDWSKRLAALTFFVVPAYGWIATPPETLEDGLALLARAGVAGAAALIAGWLLLPLLMPLIRRMVYTVTVIVTSPIRAFAALHRMRRNRAASRRAAIASREAILASAERARADELASQRRAAEQLRREESRASCHLAYNLFAPEISARFPRAEFDAYVSKYLGDDHVPEYVEQRAAQLMDLLKKHLHKVEPLRRFGGVDELAAWFQDQARQIEGIADERMRQNCLALLKTRYAEMTTQFLEEMQS